jgi:hypothetical protein
MDMWWKFWRQPTAEEYKQIAMETSALIERDLARAVCNRIENRIAMYTRLGKTNCRILIDKESFGSDIVSKIQSLLKRGFSYSVDETGDSDVVIDIDWSGK